VDVSIDRIDIDMPLSTAHTAKFEPETDEPIRPAISLPDPVVLTLFNLQLKLTKPFVYSREWDNNRQVVWARTGLIEIMLLLLSSCC
jgi:hypothetical protein